jgi:phospholipid/cholesterol/gamma-HCH transport system substrate-binding protein
MNNKNFAVGVFVAIALAVFVFATLWLTGRQSSEPTVHYSMFFETDVGGLMLGGPVFYLGVEVGTVTAMEIIPGNPMRVRVDAELLKSAPIDAGTYASLAFQGITGVAVIKLYADPGVHAPLVPDSDSSHPVIQVRDTGFSALLAKAPEIVEKIDSVLVQINGILGDENRALVHSMLNDISTITGALAEEEDSIRELPGLINQAIKEIDSSLAQIRAMAADLEPGLAGTLENLEMATGNLARMTARLDAWTANNDQDMNAFMGDGLGQVPALVADTRETLREIRKLVRELRRDPSQLIYQPNEDTVGGEK